MNNKHTCRDNSIDAVAGILIINMILRHTIQRTGMTTLYLYEFTQYFSFIIPWFFFKGGMFFKPCSIKESIAKGWKHLVIPFLKYSLLGHLFICILFYMEGDMNWIHYLLTPLKEIVLGGAVFGNLPLWFLLSFFVVRVLANLCFKNLKMVFIAFISCYAISNVLFYSGFKEPFWVSNICFGLAFYSLGYIIRQAQYKIPIVFLAFCIYAYFGISGLTIVDMRSNHLIRGIYAIYPLWALSGIVLMNNIFKHIRIKPIEHIGKDSMDYYVYHWIVITILSIIFMFFHIPVVGLQSLLIISISLCCILPLLNNLPKKIPSYLYTFLKTIHI